eukprot:GHVL01021259.1.p1 GENE.GHVL01021259.1~~GHVL01021259.1.p1  ORF type:complete len:210 (+),score=37.97 GHVL01021259.1:482-1111(+)
MMFSKDFRFLVTADRSGKIRISRYPRTDVIHSHCLSHTGIITSISCDNSYLLSGASDCSLKLWHFPDGGTTPIAEESTEDIVTQIVYDENSKLFIIVVEGLRGVLCYNIENDENIIKLKLIKKIKLESVPQSVQTMSKIPKFNSKGCLIWVNRDGKLMWPIDLFSGEKLIDETGLAIGQFFPGAEGLETIPCALMMLTRPPNPNDDPME